MELARRMTQPKEPRLERVNRSKIAVLNPLGKEMRFFVRNLSCLFVLFQVLLFQNYVMYFLCRVAFISLMSRGRQSVYFAASDTTRHSGLFILLQQNLMQPYVRGFLKPPQSDIECLSVCQSASVSVSPSVCLCTSSSPPPQKKPVSFQPDSQKCLIYVVWAYTDIFVQDFFRTCDPKRGKRAFGEQPDFTQRSK